MQRLGIGLCLMMYVAAGMAAKVSTGGEPIKAFLAHTDVKYGSEDDARTLEGRLYDWAKSGASLATLQARAAKEFDLPRPLADQLVVLTLQRGAREEDSGKIPGLVEQYIALARAYPHSELAMMEAGRTIGAPSGDCDIGAYERLLQGRPDADADRVKLFNAFYCLPLLTERTSNAPPTVEPYLTLAVDGGSTGNDVLNLAILRLADAKAQTDPAVSVHVRYDVRKRRLREELAQGYLKDAVALLPASPGQMDHALHDQLDPATLRAIAGAYLALGQVPQAQAWRNDQPTGGASLATGNAAGDAHMRSEAEAGARYEARLLDYLLHPSSSDAFDLLVQHHRLDSTFSSGAYWGGVWSHLYDRIAIEQGYPGFVENAAVPVMADKLAETRTDAIRRCYRCAPDLLAMVEEVAGEVAQPAAAAQQADGSQLPLSVRKAMDAAIATPRPGWSEHPLPVALRQPHPKPKSSQPDDGILFAESSKTPSVRPPWASRLPGGELVRYEQQGQRVVAITVSQSLDPTGEISAGGYWVSLSDDGGEHFQAPLYTGLRMFEPYVVLPKSKLPMLAGAHLQLEVAVRQIDDEHVMLPPVFLPMKSKRDDVYVDIALADLARDTDGDGLTDMAEWAMLLDPDKADTDGDGIPDGIDPLPQVATSLAKDPHAPALVAVLSNLFGKSLGAIVTTSATGTDPGHAFAVTGSTDNYNSASATFVEAPAAYFSGIAMRGRMIVLNKQQAAALQKARGISFTMSIPVFEVSHDGSKALIVWSSGWVGGTYLLTRNKGGWKVETLQRWIT